MELTGGLLIWITRGQFMNRFVACVVMLFSFGHERYFALGGGVVLTKSQSDLRSITLDWTPLNSQILPAATSNGTSGAVVFFLVKYCEDHPWDDMLRSCKSFQTNETQAQLKDLQPSTKYLVDVQEAPARSARMLTPDGAAADSQSGNSIDGELLLDKSKAFAIETQKYAVRNVDCKKGQTDVTIETGEDFEGVISVQRPDGRPDSHCLIRGYGTAQRTYILPINHSQCPMEFLENGTIMNAVILIQEHASLVLGSDRSLRISCNYQPAVIRLETGMGGKGSRMIQMGSPEDEGKSATRSVTLRQAATTSHPPVRQPNLPDSPTPTGSQTHLNRVPATVSVSISERRPDAGQPVVRDREQTSPGPPVKDQADRDFYGSRETYPARVVSAPRPRQYSYGTPPRMAGESTLRIDNRKVAAQPREVEQPALLQATRRPVGLPDFLENDVLIAANFSHPETVPVQENVRPRGGGISLLQVIAITATCSLVAIILVCFLIWLIVFRDACSQHRHSKRTKPSHDQLRFG